MELFVNSCDSALIKRIEENKRLWMNLKKAG